MKVLLSGIVIAIALRLLAVLPGWYIDITFPGGMFSPFVYIFVVPSMMLYACLIVPIWTTASTLLNDRGITPLQTARNIFLSVFVVVLALPLPFFPNIDDGFLWRLNSYSPAEYQSLRIEVAREMKELGIGEYDRYWELEHEDVMDRLRTSFHLLDVSSFPVELSASDDTVSIEWASGLTGGFVLHIYENPAKPNRPRAVQVYPRVIGERVQGG